MDNKKVLSEAGRWLRVGTLTVSTLGPIVGTLLTRLREQPVVLNNSSPAIAKASGTRPVVLVETEEKPSLSESIALLKERAYNQDLVRRAEELAEELRQRSARLSQNLAERGSDLTQELSKRSSDLTHELSKRSSDIGHELGKRSEKVGKNLSKQTRQVSRNISEQDSTFWIVSGFSVGLLLASAAAFILIRSRIKQQQGQEEDEHILLSQNGHLNLQNGNGAQPGVNGASSAYPSTATPNMTVTKPAPASVSTASAPAPLSSTGSIPVDAAFLGLSSTKRYYPAQTPLDQLSTKTDQPVDIIYFSSEEEAQAQGFTAAEK